MNRIRTLIVDDCPDHRDLATHHLRRSAGDIGVNCEIETAEDGEMALELLCPEKTDLLITDLTMPKMHGHELVEQIHERDKGHLAVVIVSGGISTDLRAGLQRILALDGPRIIGVIHKTTAYPCFKDMLRAVGGDPAMQQAATRALAERTLQDSHKFGVKLPPHFEALARQL